MTATRGNVTAKATFFDKDGGEAGPAIHTFLPIYLDWMPIEVKVFWFITVGNGPPEAVNMLFHSQGEQRLVKINKPLQRMSYKELKEQENGLEALIQEYIQRNGFSRVPRNQ